MLPIHSFAQPKKLSRLLSCATMVVVVDGGQPHVRDVRNLQQHIDEQDLAQWLFRNTELTMDGTICSLDHNIIFWGCQMMECMCGVHI